jgi:hypothetical protein
MTAMARHALAAALLLATAAALLPHPAAAAKPAPRPLVAAGSTQVAQSSEPGAYRATIQPGSPGRRIGQILGVSVEWDRVGDYDNARWARVFGMLGPSPIIRVGGSSAELLDKVGEAEGR